MILRRACTILALIGLLLILVGCEAAAVTVQPSLAPSLVPSESADPTELSTDSSTATESAEIPTLQPTVGVSETAASLTPPTTENRATASTVPQTATATFAPTDDGQITGDNLLPEIVGARVEAREMADPRLNESTTPVRTQATAPGSEFWYAAPNYLCEGDPAQLEVCLPAPSAADENVELGIPEFEINQCPPHDAQGENCDPTLTGSSYLKPAIFGWQWRIDLDNTQLEPKAGRECVLEWDVYLWSPNPTYSRLSGDWFISGALTENATEDDFLSAAMLAGASDGWVYRDHGWLVEQRYSYPDLPVAPSEGGNQAMPFDRWDTYAYVFELPNEIDQFVVFVGFDFRWDWQNTAYVRNVSLICDEVYSYQLEQTPTQIVRATPTMVPAQATFTPEPNERELPAGSTYTTEAVRNLRITPDANRSDNIIRTIAAGTYEALALYQDQRSEWALICQPGLNPRCGYAAIRIDGRIYGVLREGVSPSLLDISSLLPETGGGGISDMEETTFNPETLLALLMVLIQFVPVLGGVVGIVVGLLVDAIKAGLLLAGRTLPDQWGGRLALILNFVIWVGLSLYLGTQPSEVLPADVEVWFKVAATALTLVLMLLAQFFASRKAHGALVPFAPTLFSATRNKFDKQYGGDEAQVQVAIETEGTTSVSVEDKSLS